MYLHMYNKPYTSSTIGLRTLIFLVNCHHIIYYRYYNAKVWKKLYPYAQGLLKSIHPRC